MYKFFAVVFYSLPVLFLGLYALDSRFFFDHIFIYLLLIGATSYIAFAIYFVGQTFFTVRNDSFLSKVIQKVTKLKFLRFMKVGHVTNALAFIWVTLLFSIMFSLFFFLVSFYTTRMFGPQLEGMIRYVSGSSNRDNQILSDINALDQNMDLLLKSRYEDKKGEFLAINKKEYIDLDTDYEYKIVLSEDNINYQQTKPRYNYYLIICTKEYEYDHCNRSPITPLHSGDIDFAQNEVITEIHGDVFNLEAKDETLHRVRIITDRRTVDLMAVFSNTSTTFRKVSKVLTGEGYENTSELYEYSSGDRTSQTFNYEKYQGDTLEYSLKKNFYFNSIAGRIQGDF